MLNKKKQLLLITTRQKLIAGIGEGLSLHFEISVSNSLHTGYNQALKLLPDIILVDYISF